MDAFDLVDYANSARRRLVQFGTLGVISALALSPTAREWCAQQSVAHGKHIADDILKRFDLPLPVGSKTTSPTGGAMSQGPA